ncbi:hypothetical protein G9A89_008067 [Geosiphon pyriformis]|nr:hypothetical protein G9A89_008067 [Geosiphon pyriformis]
MLALKTIPELSITVTGNHINYTQTEVVTNLAPNSRKYHPYKKNTKSYTGIHLPELLKLALRENLMLTPISIPPNATIQQKLQLCLNEENTEYPPIYRYFHIGKTLYERKLELTTANLTKEAIQKQLHNEFKTTAGSTNSRYRLRAALRLYDLFHTCENVLQNPIFQPLKIQYIGKLTELKFQQFSDQISSIILDYYLEKTDSTWTSMELSLEEEQISINNITEKRPKTSSNIGLMENQSFNKSTFQTKSNIPPDKPITALYINARVREIDIKLILNSGSAGSIITKQLMDQLGCRIDHAATAWIITADGNTKILIGKINNFSFKINGIQISTKVLIIEATQYQALPMLLSTRTPKNFNSYLTDSMPKSQLHVDTLKPNVPRNPLLNSKTHQCHQPLRLIRFHGWMIIKLNYPHHQPEKKKEKTKLKKNPNRTMKNDPPPPNTITDLWNNTPCFTCGEILPDKRLWNDVPGKGRTCDEACQYIILINDWVQKGTPIEDAWK